MSQSDTHFGYSPEGWRLMVDAGATFLRDEARLGRTTTYTELCAVIRQRTGAAIDTGEYALAFLLGDISRSANESGALISSLVLYLGENRPGEGFFKLAQEEGLLPKGTIASGAKDEF